VNVNLKRIWKGAVVAYFKALSCNLAEECKEHRERSQSSREASKPPEYETGQLTTQQLHSVRSVLRLGSMKAHEITIHSSRSNAGHLLRSLLWLVNTYCSVIAYSDALFFDNENS